MLEQAEAVILPGVGAYGTAMAALRSLGLADALVEFARSGKTLIGICLGMQLLMSESFEFGRHRGLGIIEGSVMRLPSSGHRPKIPQIGWNRISRPAWAASPDEDPWRKTPLDGLPGGTFMYFVHSYYTVPVDEQQWLAVSTYGSTQFCSALTHGNVVGLQFHPERSADRGLQIYRTLAALILERRRVVA